MDDVKRETVIKIREALEDMHRQGKIAAREAGKQLIMIAYDYLEAGEYFLAWDAVARADEMLSLWHTGPWTEMRRADAGFKRAFDSVDDVFNLEWFRTDGGGYAS